MHPQNLFYSSLLAALLGKASFKYNFLIIIQLTGAWMRNGIMPFYMSNLKTQLNSLILFFQLLRAAALEKEFSEQLETKCKVVLLYLQVQRAFSAQWFSTCLQITVPFREPLNTGV